jgi:adenylosuccinate synthase
MMKELANLEKSGVSTRGKLKISDRAHFLFDFHQLIDGRQEAELKEGNIGTTKKGIGPCYSSKTTRNGIRVGELADFDHFSRRLRDLTKNLQSLYRFEYDVEEEIERYRRYRDQMEGMVIDGVYFIHDALKKGKSILAEGANAALLDVDFGTYPYVTSSSTAAGGVSTGLSIPPNKIQTVIGIVKAYTTRVGSGPFPTELTDSIGAEMRSIGREFGTTTGRPRRCGWLDIPVIQYSHALNNYNSINITKLDVLSSLKEIKIGVGYKLRGKMLSPGMMPSTLDQLANVDIVYETMRGWQTDISKCKTVDDLPKEARAYLKRIEELTSIPISWVGVGPGRHDMATKGFKAMY